MKAFMFPGQGAQQVGMGGDVFAAHPEKLVTANDVLGYSIVDLCVEGPMERLSNTAFTQPALYVVGALKYLDRTQDGTVPDYLLGHSVAEYVALYAAGVVSFEDGLRLVQKRGALMADARGGGMAAVLGLDADAVQDVIRSNGLHEVHAANFNTPKQIVVSGLKSAVEAAEAQFLSAGATHYRVLQVSGAFHTPFMQQARGEFESFLQDIPFERPRIPVISNVTARPHTPDQIKARMVEQITAPVRWAESIRYLLAKGLKFSDFEEMAVSEMGIVKPMVKRTELEAGPLDTVELDREEQAERAAAEMVTEDSAPAEPMISSSDVREPAHKPVRHENARGAVHPEGLGSAAFRDAFGVRLAYMAGAMYQGIASAGLVVRLAKSGLLGFYGAGGQGIADVRRAIAEIRSAVLETAPWGVNFIAQPNHLAREEELTDLLISEGVRVIEASSFMEVTPALIRYRAKGLSAAASEKPENRIVAKVSRPEVAAQFLAPAPERLLSKMLASGAITEDEAARLRTLPMADAITIEADSGGHTDQGMPYGLVPAILRLRNEMGAGGASGGASEGAASRGVGQRPVFVGAGGGIGTPEAAAAAFVMGVDYVVTGSINQCSVEAGTSDAVKDMLQDMAVQDTDYAPSGALFELGSRIQVLKKGVFFPARANKLYQLYRQHTALDQIEPDQRRQIEERYFHRSLDTVFEELKSTRPEAEIAQAMKSPKHRMAMVFKRYFKDTTDLALAGDMTRKVDFQIHCGPAMGAFNQWVNGGELGSWKARHVDCIADRLMDGTANLLTRRIASLLGERSEAAELDAGNGGGG